MEEVLLPFDFLQSALLYSCMMVGMPEPALFAHRASKCFSEEEVSMHDVTSAEAAVFLREAMPMALWGAEKLESSISEHGQLSDGCAEEVFLSAEPAGCCYWGCTNMAGVCTAFPLMRLNGLCFQSALTAPGPTWPL